jgi:hypothetical protein
MAGCGPRRSSRRVTANGTDCRAVTVMELVLTPEPRRAAPVRFHYTSSMIELTTTTRLTKYGYQHSNGRGTLEPSTSPTRLNPVAATSITANSTRTGSSWISPLDGKSLSRPHCAVTIPNLVYWCSAKMAISCAQRMGASSARGMTVAKTTDGAGDEVSSLAKARAGVLDIVPATQPLSAMKFIFIIIRA